MFTGIIEELAEVVALEAHGAGAVLTVRAADVGRDVPHGSSIAVNGVCLTVVGASGDGPVSLQFDVMGETLERSVIGELGVGDVVNLERAARADSRLDGHIVQGHVDGTGTLVHRRTVAGPAGGGWDLVRFAMPGQLARYVAEKGSVAVDGVSLTVTGVGDDWFEVGLIPETLRATTLGRRAEGEHVNLEVDVLAKYVARLMERS